LGGGEKTKKKCNGRRDLEMGLRSRGSGGKGIEDHDCGRETPGETLPKKSGGGSAISGRSKIGKTAGKTPKKTWGGASGKAPNGPGSKTN